MLEHTPPTKTGGAQGPVAVAAVLMAFVALHARAETGSSLQEARTALEQTRQTQDTILNQLSGLAAGRQQTASTAELLSTLATIQQMQVAVIRSTRAMIAKTFGQTDQQLAMEDRQVLDQIASDQRAVRQRFGDWVTAMSAAAAGTSAEPLRAVQSRVNACPAGGQMDQIVEQIGKVRLAEASTTGQLAADELARLLQALETATIDPADLKDKRLRHLREIAQQQHAMRGKLEPPPAGAVEWRRLQREQADLGERARVMGFEESGFPPNALQVITQAHQLMRQAEQALRSQNKETAIQAVNQAAAALDEAIRLIETAAAEDKDPDLPTVPLVKQKPGKAVAGMSTVGGSESGSDSNAIAQIAADIALVVKLRRQQKELHEETLAKRPARPNPAERQAACAGQLPQLIRRVESYLLPAAADLDHARRVMIESAELLRNQDKQNAAARQSAALADLAAAEEKMRAFWQNLFEAMTRISNMAGAGLPHGGAPQGKENKDKMGLLLAMLREVVRVGMLMKDQDALIEQTRRWADTDADKLDKEAVVTATGRQRELGVTARDIFEKLQPVASEAQGLPEAVMEASQFMDGAGDALEGLRFGRALERQEAAIQFLENAWSVMAMSVSSMTQSEQAGLSDPNADTGQSKAGIGQDIQAGSDTGGDAGKPWYWDLPPSARDAVSQSMGEAFPATYAPAIKRYYERLSKRQGGNRAN